MIVVVMGVSGSGKSTVGEALAQSLGCEFLDADDFHPPENVAKMASGTPLTDDDRWPWLERLHQELLSRESSGRSAVLACSALKAVYRARLMDGLSDARLVYLRGSKAFLRARVAERKHKYMPASLLDSQFATLEPPTNAIEVDVALSVEEAVQRIGEALATKGRPRTP
jgi:gluconokinase